MGIRGEGWWEMCIEESFLCVSNDAGKGIVDGARSWNTQGEKKGGP